MRGLSTSHRGLVAALLACLSLSGCPRNRAGTPESAYAAFAQAVQLREDDAAFQLLSTSSQDGVQRRAEAVVRAADGGVTVDAAELFFSSPYPPSPVTSIRLVRREGDVAWLKVTVDQKEEDARMVREQGNWRVDLHRPL